MLNCTPWARDGFASTAEWEVAVRRAVGHRIYLMASGPGGPYTAQNSFARATATKLATSRWAGEAVDQLVTAIEAAKSVEQFTAEELVAIQSQGGFDA